MTRTSRFDFGSGQNPDPDNRWDTKCKPFSLAEVCALPRAVLVLNVLGQYIRTGNELSQHTSVYFLHTAVWRVLYTREQQVLQLAINTSSCGDCGTGRRKWKYGGYMSHISVTLDFDASTVGNGR